ncbi:unnamed protein product [Closterium sp. NIES-53]
MALCPSSVPLRVPLPPPPESSLPAVPDPESGLTRAATPTVSRLLATVVTDPSFEATGLSALVCELLDFAAACLSCSSCTSFASMLLAPEGDPDAPNIPTPRSMYVEGALRCSRLHTAFLQGSLHKEIWLRSPPGLTGSFPAGTEWSLRRPVYGLRLVPREWHDRQRTIFASLGFAPSTTDSSLFLRTDTSLPPFYILVYVDDLVFATADTEALTLVKSELKKRHTCIDLGELRSYLGLEITWDRARRTITLTRSHMVHQVLQCFGF